MKLHTRPTPLRVKHLIIQAACLVAIQTLVAPTAWAQTAPGGVQVITVSTSATELYTGVTPSPELVRAAAEYAGR